MSEGDHLRVLWTSTLTGTRAEGTTAGGDLVSLDCLVTSAMESYPETWEPEEGSVNRGRDQDWIALNLNALMHSRILRGRFGLCHTHNHKL